MVLVMCRFLDTKGRILEAIAALVVKIDFVILDRLELQAMMLVEIKHSVIGCCNLRV